MTHYDSPRDLINALEALYKIDLDKLFASGIDVTIHDYSNEDRVHMPRVSLAAHDFEPVRKALIECVAKSIERRKKFLVSQIQDLNSATYKYLGV